MERLSNFNSRATQREESFMNPTDPTLTNHWNSTLAMTRYERFSALNTSNTRLMESLFSDQNYIISNTDPAILVPQLFRLAGSIQHTELAGRVTLYDIFTPEDAKRMYEETGCDLIMAGRGTLGRPWLFSQINDYLTTGSYEPEPDVETKMDVMLAHAKRICELRGDKVGMLEIRKHALWYTKGLKGSAKLRNKFSNVSSFEELHLLAERTVFLTK